MALTISGLRDFGRNFCKKRSNVASLILILSVFTFAHFSIVNLQKAPLRPNAVRLEETSSLKSVLRNQPSKEDHHHLCNNTCVETFIDNFLLADDDFSEEEQIEKKTVKKKISYSSPTKNKKIGESQSGPSKGSTILSDDSSGGLTHNQSSIIESEEKEEEEEDGDDDIKHDFLLPTRLRGKNQQLYQVDTAANLSSTWTEAMAEERRQVFQERAKTITKSCQHLKKTKGFFSPKMGKIQDNLRWVRSHNMVWCPIFKSASTTWVKNLLMIAGEKYLDKSLHGRVRELYAKPSNPKERNQVLKASMKVIIVRHPLDRLLSAYRDKMLRVRSAKDPYVKIQKAIVKAYKDPLGIDPTTSKIFSGDPSGVNKTFIHPTFSQFLLKVKDDLQRYWIKEGQSQVNLHWRPYWMTCGPCKINYDVIAQVETLGPDQEYIIRELGLQDILYNAHTHASNFDSYNDTSEAAKHYFSQIQRNLLNEVVKFYQPDFELFGYSPKPYIELTVNAT